MDDNESHAYHIALKTLRERSHYLQTKLEAAEEENYKLRLQITQDSTNKSPRTTPDVNNLQTQVALLTKQKSLLSHQVQMVTNENRTLWSRLSKLTAVNQNLGSKLSMITDTLNRHDASLTQSTFETGLDPQKNKSAECSKESLEEISLKIINGILLEKTELESQYAQMVDLQNDNETVDIQNFCFSLPEEDDSSVLSDINKHVQKLNQFKQLLLHQNNELTGAITNFKNVKKNYVCNNCVNNVMLHCDSTNPASLNSNTVPNDIANIQESTNELPTLRIESTVDVNEVQNQDLNQICPMCGALFSGPFQQFHDHVSNHFEDEDDSFHDVASTFEVLP